MANTPIVDMPNQYIYGFQMVKTGNRTLTLTPGEARSSQNTNDIVVSGTFNIPTVFINCDIIGVNGMARAAIAINSAYYVFICGDSTGNNSPCAIVDIAQFNPLLPVGYDVFRRIGFLRTDASANILPFTQIGCSVVRTYFYDTPINILSGGSATTFTSINLTFVPQNSFNALAYLDITYTPNGATDVAEFLPFNSVSATGCVRFGTGVAGAQVGQICVPYVTIAGVPRILYKVTAGDTLTLGLSGFTDSLAE